MPKLLREINQAEAITAAGQRLHLQVAIDYSSRDTIARAALGPYASFVDERPRSAETLAHMIVEALAAGSGEVDLRIAL